MNQITNGGQEGTGSVPDAPEKYKKAISWVVLSDWQRESKAANVESLLRWSGYEPGTCSDSMASAACDCLVDVLHFCACWGLEFDDLMAKSQTYYEKETGMF